MLPMTSVSRASILSARTPVSGCSSTIGSLGASHGCPAPRTSRPALTDLRFKGDAWVIAEEAGTAALYLGNYSLVQIAVSPFDLPSLNRTLQNVRSGKARRQASAQRGTTGGRRTRPVC
jgi:hypothetical protein